VILENIRVLEKDYKFENFQTLPERKTLDLPEFDFCLFTQMSCLESVFKDNKTRLEDKSVVALKERYLRFLKFDDFVDLSKPVLSAPRVDHLILLLANDLVLLDSIRFADAGHPEKAIERLFIMLKGLKRYAAKTGNILGKVIIFTLLNSTLDVLFLLSRQYRMNTKEHSIAPLSKIELSFEKPLVREFLSLAAINEKLHQNVSWNWEGFVSRFVFKENMTLNQFAFQYWNAIQRSEVDQVDYLAIVQKHEKLKEEKPRIPHPIGGVLAKVSDTNFDPFITRGFDLNAKIALFNGLLGKEITPENVSRISNPYDPSTTAKITTEGVCFLTKGEEKSTLCLSADSF